MTAGSGPETTTRGPGVRVRFLLLWIIPIVVMGVVSVADQVLSGGDIYWRVAAGRWVLAHGAIPTTDPFSLTYAGRPWALYDWLGDASLAIAWLAAGWPAVMLLVGLAMGAVTALSMGWLLRWLTPWAAAVAFAVGLVCSAPFLAAEPETLALPLLALWTTVLLQARLENRPPNLLWVLLIGLWANLDPSFIVGLAMAGALMIEALLDIRHWTRAGLLGWAGFVGGAVVASLATPQGLDGLTHAIAMLNMKTPAQVWAWRGPDFFHLSMLELVILAIVFACFWRGAKLTAMRAAVLVGFIHLALQHLRQEVLLGVVAPLILAEPLGRTRGVTAAMGVPWSIPRPQMALATGVLAFVAILRLAMLQPTGDSDAAPVKALAAAPPALRGQPVLSDSDIGGYLIFQGVRPYIDGRWEMYGADFIASDDQLQRGSQPAIDAALAGYHLRWAILHPDRRLTDSLEQSPDWKRLYADQHAVVLERIGP